jgi:hypothetical protein
MMYFYKNRVFYEDSYTETIDVYTDAILLEEAVNRLSFFSASRAIAGCLKKNLCEKGIVALNYLFQV